MWNRIEFLYKKLTALEYQVETEGCAAAHYGETTYECDIQNPCGLCRMRNKYSALLDNQHP